MAKRNPSAFEAHDTHGIPLAITLMIRGDTRCCARFYFEALAKGWNDEHTLDLIEGACRDNGLPFDRGTFLLCVALVWREFGKDYNDPECWTVCASYCVL